MILFNKLISALYRLDLGDPVADRCEGLSIGHIVHEKYALRAAEVGGGDRAKALLASGIPYLKSSRISRLISDT